VTSTLALLGATAPDPGQPSFPAFAGACVMVAFTSGAMLVRRPREEVQWLAFLGAFSGTAAGLVAYLAGLFTGLY